MSIQSEKTSALNSKNSWAAVFFMSIVSFLLRSFKKFWHRENRFVYNKHRQRFLSTSKYISLCYKYLRLLALKLCDALQTISGVKYQFWSYATIIFHDIWALDIIQPVAFSMRNVIVNVVKRLAANLKNKHDYLIIIFNSSLNCQIMSY